VAEPVEDDPSPVARPENVGTANYAATHIVRAAL
jgi:hypothetical protein